MDKDTKQVIAVTLIAIACATYAKWFEIIGWFGFALLVCTGPIAWGLWHLYCAFRGDDSDNPARLTFNPHFWVGLACGAACALGAALFFGSLSR